MNPTPAITARPSARLHHRFPRRKRDINRLLRICKEMQLDHEQERRLCEELFRSPKLLDDFLKAQQASCEVAEKFVLAHILHIRPKREENQSLFGILNGRWAPFRGLFVRFVS
jgi:uncharacterized coiled-coil DUF342 family protein